MNNHPAINLAPPGAGLPWIELQIARVIFFSALARADRSKSDALLLSEKDEILSLIKPFTEEDLIKPVLIKRLRGMEDSSRNWSVYMTLSHIAIVNQRIAKVTELLSQGKAPEKAANTADVKPMPGIGSEAVAAFTDSCDSVIKVAHSIQDLRTKARYAHPWFGPLDARAWNFLAGFHTRLHRKQIEAILLV